MAGGIPASVRLFLFGRVRLTYDGEPRKLAALPRALPLLALVAVRGIQPVVREALAYAMWPDEGEREARANLRRHLYSIRRALPPECDPFVVDDVHVAWNARSALWCDVVAFERERAAGRFDAALELYGGPLLDDSLEEPICAERERLQNVFVTLGIERARAARSAGEVERAIEIVQRVASADPWREDVVRTLMEMRNERGDRAGALDVCDRFARRLQRELGVEPMTETLALRARIAAAPAPPAPSPRGSAAIELRFVERGRELGELDEVAAFTGGTPPAAFVAGEAGIGKSRLVAEFARRCEARGFAVAAGGVSAGGDRTPYLGFVDALRPYAARLPALLDAPRAQLLGTLFEPAANEAERSRSLVLDAFAAAFEALARERPLLVTIEDVHWAGSATVDALAFMARRFAAGRAAIALVATYRSEELGPRHPLEGPLRALIDEGAAKLVAVGPLSAGGVRAALGDAPPAGDPELLARELAALSEGNPFFLSEALRDRLERAEGEVAHALPASIGEVLEARLDRLDERSRSLLEVAAIVGDAFSLDLVRAAAGFGESEARAAIDELLDRQLVRDGGRGLGYRFVFAHNLLRAYVYDAIPPNVRDRRHLRIATIVERRSSGAALDAAADLAHHFDRGGDHENAARYSLVAARQFARVAAFDEAAAHAERGIALARDPEVRFDLLLARERAADARGERERQAEILDAAGAMARELGDDRRSFDLLQRRTAYLRTCGLRDEESAAVERLVELARELHDPASDAAALLQRAKTAVLLGDRDPRPDLAHALRLLEAAGDPAAHVRALCDASSILTFVRKPFEAQEYLAAARGLSERCGDD